MSRLERLRKAFREMFASQSWRIQGVRTLGLNTVECVVGACGTGPYLGLVIPAAHTGLWVNPARCGGAAGAHCLPKAPLTLHFTASA